MKQAGAKLKADSKWKQQSHMLRAAMAAARGDAPSGDMLFQAALITFPNLFKGLPRVCFTTRCVPKAGVVMLTSQSSYSSKGRAYLMEDVRLLGRGLKHQLQVDSIQTGSCSSACNHVAQPVLFIEASCSRTLFRFMPRRMVNCFVTKAVPWSITD